LHCSQICFVLIIFMFAFQYCSLESVLGKNGNEE